MRANEGDLWQGPDARLKRALALHRIGAVVFALAFGVGAILLLTTSPLALPILPGIALFTAGLLNLPLALLSLRRVRRELDRRWYERAAWVSYEAAQLRPDLRPSPSVGLARRSVARRVEGLDAA